MSRTKLAVVATITLLGSFAGGPSAAAQWGPAPAPNPWATGQPAPEQTYPNAPTPPQAPTPPPSTAPSVYGQPQYTQAPYVRPAPSRRRMRLYGTIGIGVPIFLKESIQLYRPGANLRFEGGLEFRWIAPFFDLGFRWTPIDFDRYVRHGGNPIYSGFGRSPLQSFYFGVGVRLMVPDLKRVIPYVSGAFDMNFWNFREVAPVCGLWFCTVANIYYFSPGFTGRLGLAIKIVERIYIDVNVGLGMTFPGQFWNHNENWIEPMVSFMHRR